MPTLFKDWPKQDVALPIEDVISMYEQGYMGAKYDPQAAEELEQEIISQGGYVQASDAASDNGWADSHKGELVIPFIHVLKAYPGCWPGPAQEIGDCVVRDTANVCLGSLVCEVVGALPDQVSGKVEVLPEVSALAIANGVLSSEALYWFRGYDDDGWSCQAAAKVAMTKAGCVLRKAYPEAGIDLTTYSGKLSHKFGKAVPTFTIADALDNNLIRTCTTATSFEEVRDLLGNGYFVSSCGSEGFDSKRDANGVAKRKGSWSHAMGIIAADDRKEITTLYGEPLVLLLNQWGSDWITGPKIILGTKQDIPDGSFWARWSDVRKRVFIAFSSINGWPKQTIPNFITGVL